MISDPKESWIRVTSHVCRTWQFLCHAVSFFMQTGRSEPPAALSAPSAEEADWSVEEAERATSPWRWLWWPPGLM